MEIKVDVSPETAKAFNAASKTERERLVLLFENNVNINLKSKKDRKKDIENFWKTIEPISKKAQESGLTEEILEEILKNEK